MGTMLLAPTRKSQGKKQPSLFDEKQNMQENDLSSFMVAPLHILPQTSLEYIHLVHLGFAARKKLSACWSDKRFFFCKSVLLRWGLLGVICLLH
jgi:hypothetical protein